MQIQFKRFSSIELNGILFMFFKRWKQHTNQMQGRKMLNIAQSKT